MKTLKALSGWIVVVSLLPLLTANAVTLTSDTYLGISNASLDGQDITVTNCTLTVDGAHGFNSLQLLNGAVLTHSALTNGSLLLTNVVSGEMQTLSVSNVATLLNTNVDTNTIVVTDTGMTTTYTPGVDYTVQIVAPFTQLQLTTNSAITEGASVLVSYHWIRAFQGFTLTVTNNMQVFAGAAINVSGKGYAGGNGLGAGGSSSTNYPFTFTAGGGGGHGGAGGMSSILSAGGLSYDSTTNPAAIGSGGGTGTTNGGAGGGAAQLFVGTFLQLDGQILADGLKGTNAHSGGGAGGSILISAASINGAGTISAQGGAGSTPDGGGGGGGRIALYFQVNEFTGTTAAFGGAGASAGGAGTIYQQNKNNAFGELQLINTGVRGASSTFDASNLDNVTVSGGALARPTTLSLITSNLLVGSNSWLVSALSVPLNLTVNGNATVESNASINADFKSTSGPGAGTGNGTPCSYGSGGGYGGYGGASACGTAGGGVYGSITSPISMGSPGGASPIALGGGAIHMTVAGTLTLSGTLSANGASASGLTSAGGSGGSVWLTAGTLAGNGSISANGGSASNSVSGGGGGGRVAIYANTNLFTGPLTAYGGAGTNAGGPGTVFFQTNSTSTFVQLFINNDGLKGSSTIQVAINAMDLTISGGATVTNAFPGSVNLRNLFIGSNSWFTMGPPGITQLNIVATNGTIQPGGGISADGASVTTGNSAGQSLNNTGGGGGNAGNGGASATNASGGNGGGGSITIPTSGGGIGGNGINSGAGGNGGGAVNLTFTRSLQVDGIITANGANGPAFNSGGGAGGSIWLKTQTISGSGALSANGGAGNNSIGGGGGGGYISITYTTNLFLGPITARGGAGANYGGAGTVYINQLSHLQLTIDNGGNRGAATPLTSSLGIFDFTVSGGAIVSNGVTSGLVIGNLLVGSNSTITSAFTSQQSLSVFTNATIQAGGSLTFDGAGTFGPGSGQSVNSTGGGGTYGGIGGISASNAPGGNPVQDTMTTPSQFGSRGGAGLNSVNGGNGGGSWAISVSKTLQLDGKISAEGVTGPGVNSGGGSGGSISLSAKTLSGSGVISVNGGNANGQGGGGGGGRIAITGATNQFSGKFTAYGGAGANSGGAGTVYVKITAGNNVTTQLTVDNNGSVGGNTVMSPYPSGDFDFTVTGGARALHTNSSSIIYQDVFIGSNSTLFTYPFSQQILTVLSNATIQAGGALTGDGLSTSPANAGQTLNSTGGGAGHGGYGGMSLSNAAGGTISDSITSPTSAGGHGGSGFNGSAGGNGGAAIRLTVNGTMQLDGRISSDAAASSGLNGGGGSGGAVWLTFGQLSGAGSISANGGAGNNFGGGGGGGRVSITATNNVFAGSISARGGAGANFGGAGTIYIATNGNGFSRLIVDNGGSRGTYTLLSSANSSQDLIVNSGASVQLGSSLMTWRSLTVASNASVGLSSNINSIALTISSNLSIAPGGALSLDGQGFAPNNGPGHGYPGGASGAGGGGYGGYGSMGNTTTNSGGSTYDSITSPTQAGSGGGYVGVTSGSSGGGALHLEVIGSVMNNGTISANGAPGIVPNAGGGSGGAVWMSAASLSGSGQISANGGNADAFSSGGGGGGRITLTCNSNSYTGTFSAHGGTGFGPAGGAGTIYLTTNGFGSLPQLVLDNGGSAGTNTPLDTLHSTVSLSIANSAAASSGSPLTFQSLTIGPNSFFNSEGQTHQLNLTVLSNALVNGSINADAAGYDKFVAGFPGAGAGTLDGGGDGSGAGFGGAGGASSFGAAGGGTYGSSNQPVDFGSAGAMSPPLPGFSQGGGAVRLIVDGTLTLNGNISADGNDGVIDGSGGGSGGSIWVTALNLAGNGSFTANGGMGEDGEGGGGGGGRIAINAFTNGFSGSLAVAGGSGAASGQAGTVYISTNLTISGSVTDTNGVGIAGVTLQPSGLGSVLTAGNGSYSVPVPLIWNGTISPSSGGFFLPSLRSYTNVSMDTAGQNFLMTTPTAFNFGTSGFDGTNANFTWYGINGVSYQVYSSTDLVNWAPYGAPFIGANALITNSSPTTNSPQMFFRLGVGY